MCPKRELLAAVVANKMISVIGSWVVYSGSCSGCEIECTEPKIPKTPVAKITQDEFTYIVGEEITFTSESEGADSTAWILAEAKPDKAFSKTATTRYDEPGNYQVMLIVSNEAGSDTLSRAIKVVNPIAETEPTSTVEKAMKYSEKEMALLVAGIKKKVNVYPNPVSEALFIETTNIDEELQLQLTDMAGKKVLNIILVPNKTMHQIQLSNLAGGVYLLNIGDGEVNYTEKITVAK